MKKLVLFATAGALFGAGFALVKQLSPDTSTDEPGEPGEEDGSFPFPSSLVALGVKLLPIINELVKQGVEKAEEVAAHIHQQANGQAEENDQAAESSSTPAAQPQAEV